MLMTGRVVGCRELKKQIAVSVWVEISLMFAYWHPEEDQKLGRNRWCFGSAVVVKCSPYLENSGERNDAELFQTSVFLNFGEEYLNRNEALLPASKANFAKLDLSSFVKLMDAFTSYNITDQLGQISCPTLIVVGEEDPIKGRKMAQMMGSYPSSRICCRPRRRACPLPGQTWTAEYPADGICPEAQRTGVIIVTN